MFFTTAWLTLAVAGAAAAIPVVIHLLNRRRYRVVEWAAMRFLLAARKRTVRRIRLEQWLLLLLRALILVLLVAAMAAVTPWAESYWQRLWPGKPVSLSSAGRTHHVIVIDASFSMAAAPEGRSRFEAAKREAEAAVAGAEAGDAFSVVVVGNPAEAVVIGPADQADEVIDQIRGLELPHVAGDVAGALPVIADILTKSPPKFDRRDVVILSDCQQTSWSLDAEEGSAMAQTWARILDRGRVVFVDLARADLDNLAVTGLTFNDPLAVAGLRSTVTATVRNFGRDAAQSRLRLLLREPGREPAPVGDRPLTLKPGESQSVSFVVAFEQAGQFIVEATVTPDVLPVDDTRSLVLDVRRRVPVILVDGRPASEELARGAGWLRQALNPFPPGEFVAAYPAEPEVLSLGEFADSTLGNLSEADLVFLCDLPSVSDPEAQRLDQFLKRGGTLVVGLGPNAGANLDGYNRRLGPDGVGLLPGRLVEVVTAKDGEFFTMSGDEAEFAKPPLQAFRTDAERAALTSARFGKYVRLDEGNESAAKRLLSFGEDAAIVEWPRHRGRVILFTSSLNADWTSWPLSPSFAPFVQELFRFAIDRSDRREQSAGSPIARYLPTSDANLTATVTAPDGTESEVPVKFADGAGRLLIEDTGQSGLYRAEIGAGRRNLFFAVNVPAVTPGGGSESDLTRVPAEELRGDGVIVVPSVEDIPEPEPIEGAAASPGTKPLPRGPDVARILLWVILGLVIAELILAWRLGASSAGPVRSSSGKGGRLIPALVSLPPLLITVVLLAVVGHALWTGELLGFAPESWRARAESWLGVPASAPGEGTSWRLDSYPIASPDRRIDDWVAVGAALIGVALAVLVYRRDGTDAGTSARVVTPALLRIGVILIMVGVLLPQLQLRFQREGYPEVVLIFDTSRSMSKVDTFADSEVAAAAAELSAGLGSGEASRLRLARELSANGSPSWLAEVVRDRKVRVHVYAADERLTPVGEAFDADSAAAVIAALDELEPAGNASRLTPAIESAIKRFRGRSLATVVMFTDGIACEPGTDGPIDPDLQRAGSFAARAGVPLFFVGVGDTAPPFDVALADLRVEDVVQVNDRLVFEARLAADGRPEAGELPDEVPVILSEKRGDTWVELTRQTVKLGNRVTPTTVRIRHAPTEVGEKRYRLETPELPGERQRMNNRLERLVLVTEAKRLRVLMVEGYPRYEYRFLKTLLERQLEQDDSRSVDLRVLQLDADRDSALQDRVALAAFPTAQELKQDYDAVILGDIDPRELPDATANLRAVAEFVTEKGGGLLVIAGAQSSPSAFRDTPLEDVLPIVMDTDGEAPKTPITAGYRPKLTPVGRTHPVFRIAADDAQSMAAWEELPAMRWYATGYRRKLSAEVLAVHPDRPAESNADEPHPLVLQQFTGAGRVLFFGFDETWLWREGEFEREYDAFWLRGVRMLGRGRLGRTELRLDRQSAYLEGEPIRVTVRFPDDRPAPEKGTPVRVLAERFAPMAESGGPIDGRTPIESQTLNLSRLDGARATFEVLMTRTPVGEYRFRLLEPPTDVGSQPAAEGRVIRRPGEMDRLEMNRSAMERASAASGGRFHTIADFDKLAAELPEGERVPLDEPREPWPVWNHWGVFLLVLGLFAGEWVLRKRQNLA